MEPEKLTKDTDLVFSPDDGGFYIQQYHPDHSGKTRTSPIYFTREDAIYALTNTKIDWSNWD